MTSSYRRRSTGKRAAGHVLLSNHPRGEVVSRQPLRTAVSSGAAGCLLGTARHAL